MSPTDTAVWTCIVLGLADPLELESRLGVICEHPHGDPGVLRCAHRRLDCSSI